MAREALILALGLTLIVFVARWVASHSRRHGVPGAGLQVLLGLGCGILGAIVAAAPRIDLVPDDAEDGVTLALASIVALVVVQIGWHRGALRRSLHRPARGRRAEARVRE